MKIGVLGFAHGHIDNYLREWKDHPEWDIQIESGWDHDDDRGIEACDRHGLSMHYTPGGVIQASEGVVITAETSMHADLVVECANAGKPVVLQKPMATTDEDAAKIVAAVNESGIPFTMAWQMRADPQNLKMKEMLSSGEFGKVFMVRRRHGLSTHSWEDFDDSWHVHPVYNVDIWADDASHPADFVYWLFGMPETVTAELASLLNPKVINDNGIAIYRYPDGMIAEISCSFVCNAHENTTEIIAENGTIIQNYGDGTSTSVRPPDGGCSLKWFSTSSGSWEPGPEHPFQDQGGRITNLARPLAEFFHGKRPAIATAEEGRDVLRMILATYESSERGCRVSLSR